jgi:hypothetical protein
VGGEIMPIIARFYSIIIKMYYAEDEHNPPHIHAKYNEYEGIFNIASSAMTRGNLPKNSIRLVQKFISQYRERLLIMWEKQDFEELMFKE